MISDVTDLIGQLVVGADLTANDAGIAFEKGATLAIYNDFTLARRDGKPDASPVGTRVSVVYEDASVS